MTRVHRSIGIVLIMCGIIATVCYIVRGRDAKVVKRVSLLSSSGKLVSFPENAIKLKFAVAPIISPTRSLVFYGDMLDYVEEKLHCKVEMVQRKTYAEVNFLMKEGRIDAGFVCSRPYVEGNREFGMELLCAPVCFGKSQYYSYFIVHRDSMIEDVAGLRGKLFAFSDPLSNSGMLVPSFTLAKMGESPETFFRGSIFTYSHDNSIWSVAQKLVDGAAVDSLIWEYMAIKEPDVTAQTRIIYRSSPCAIPPVVVSPAISNDLKAELRSAFLNMHLDPKGSRILKAVLIDRFTEIDDGAYDSIRQMEDFVKNARSPK